MTTDLHHSCTTKHTGTSASAPMAAAIIALALEANPDLTWRDIQHIIQTSKPLNLNVRFDIISSIRVYSPLSNLLVNNNPPFQASDWTTNAIGRNISHSYGYGLMDASAMVSAAKTWSLMPRQESCSTSSPYHFKVVPAMGSITIDMQVDCSAINIMEHVRTGFAKVP